jgi:hypothetical protein
MTSCRYNHPTLFQISCIVHTSTILLLDAFWLADLPSKNDWIRSTMRGEYDRSDICHAGHYIFSKYNARSTRSHFEITSHLQFRELNTNVTIDRRIPLILLKNGARTTWSNLVGIRIHAQINPYIAHIIVYEPSIDQSINHESIHQRPNHPCTNVIPVTPSIRPTSTRSTLVISMSCVVRTVLPDCVPIT